MQAFTVFTQRYLHRLYPFLLLLILLMFGRELIRFQSFLHDQQPPPPLPQASSNAQLPDIQAVTQLGWFGESGVMDASPLMPATSNAPLELKGISASTEEALAGAYIAQQGGTEKYYRVGDTLPGSAGTLEAISSDHVTLRNGSLLSTLTLRRP